ncbi:MAG: hypothetical protein IPK79_07055 [Vampirovibrionales bacterium]|nr:hypothetical protein [Vampirovibrionales bacterium]
MRADDGIKALTAGLFIRRLSQIWQEEFPIDRQKRAPPIKRLSKQAVATDGQIPKHGDPLNRGYDSTQYEDLLQKPACANRFYIGPRRLGDR